MCNHWRPNHTNDRGIDMTKKILPTPEQLRELLTYDPETGKLFWKERPIGLFASRRAFSAWNKRFAGQEAMSCVDEGYKTGCLFNSRVRAHRIAWALYFGSWPKDQIDHINGDRSDNRICNLRESSNAENQWNTSVRSYSSSGLKGIGRKGDSGRWMARISVNGERKYLGTFTTPEDAHRAFCEAAHKYHGEFARTE